MAIGDLTVRVKNQDFPSLRYKHLVMIMILFCDISKKILFCGRLLLGTWKTDNLKYIDPFTTFPFINLYSRLCNKTISMTKSVTHIYVNRINFDLSFFHQAHMRHVYLTRCVNITLRKQIGECRRLTGANIWNLYELFFVSKYV